MTNETKTNKEDFQKEDLKSNNDKVMNLKRLTVEAELMRFESVEYKLNSDFDDNEGRKELEIYRKRKAESTDEENQIHLSNDLKNEKIFLEQTHENSFLFMGEGDHMTE